MQESRPVRLTWQAICAAGLVLIVAYFLVPGDDTKDVLYSVLGIAATATLLAAARRQPKQLRVGWYLVAAANSCFVVGDSLSTIVHMVTGHEASPPSVTDGLYFAGYPFLFAGVLRISNLRKLPTARETRADSALVSLGALTLAWHFLMQAYADDDQLSVIGKAVTLAYPVMDIGVLYLVIFGIFSGAARHTANQLVGAAMCLLVAADFAYSELAVHSTYNPDSLSNAGFLASYVLFAAGAAVPPRSAPRRIIVPAEVRHWLPLIGGAMLVPPCVLLLSAVTGAEVNVAAIAAMSVVLTALAIVRASWLFDRLRKQAALLTQRGESLHLAIGTQHALQEDLERQASHDSLTGLANRGLLRKGIVSALAHGAPAMLFCDLDGFKEVNDSLGHGVGDELLVVVARRLSAAVRESELVARLGGDEFAILLDRVDGPADAVALAHRVVALLQQPIMIGELRIQLTASVGVAFAG
ncbi:MAG: diguanylate cyclase/phosphodiesterase, partial [Pseudonocardiales bacterium]|nr:diguanylate cyclase/phosphodiesterase [Pseudonocardiales bacterium]